MKILLKILLLFFCINTLNAQTIYEEFDSNKLGEKRDIKIQLPRNFAEDSPMKYPVVIVLDGDYLFEPVAGNIDYQSYWNDMPDCIIVGVNQATTRLSDFEFNDETYLPSQNGATFFEFISLELLPYINEKYNTTPFRIIVGHDLGANFISYYIFKEDPLFSAYIALSPEFAQETPNRLANRFEVVEKELFYYLATSDADITDLRTTIVETDNKLKNLENSKFHYNFDDFNDANHYSLVGQAIPKALNGIFRKYKPINGKEYREEVLTYSGTAFEYLEKKYDDIEYYYGFRKPVIENDLRAIAAACKKNKDDDSLGKLAKLARKTYPESMIGAYYNGLYFEAIGNYKKALQRYQSGLLLAPSQFLDKDVLLDKIYKIKEEGF